MKADHVQFKLTKSQVLKMAPLSKACYEAKGTNLVMGDAQILRNLTGKLDIITVRFGLFKESDGKKIVKHSKGKQIKFKI